MRKSCGPAEAGACQLGEVGSLSSWVPLSSADLDSEQALAALEKGGAQLAQEM